MSRPDNRENLQSLADTIVWAIETYNTQWVQQPDATLSEAAVQNTWYTILPATGVYTHIIDIFMQVTVANETLEVEITVDGLTKTGTIAATFGTDYQVRHGTTPLVDTFVPVPALTYSLLDYEGHDIMIRMRKTTATGAGLLLGKVIYATI
jgi:hypothetical protein